jgi:PPK2 family polyphosphate:nucleotide phosphotransferase
MSPPPDPRPRELLKLVERFQVKPGTTVTLEKDYDPGFRAGSLSKKEGEVLLQMGVDLMREYQERLAAEARHGVLVVLQGIDAAGKDGTIRHVMSGVNPQGVGVHSFKVPSEEEVGHDFLWRYSRCLPGRGEIAIFNRSHYEEILVARVHPEVLERERLPANAGRGDVWRRRFRAINSWERYLVENGFPLVKLFLNISREEQRVRFLKRIDLADKNWKFSASDVDERAYWDDYQRAFSAMLTHTSTDWAPWYVIPADHKWFARIAVGAVLAHALIELDPQYPVVDDAVRRELADARVRLEAEAPKGKTRDPHQAKRSASRRARP